MKPVKFTNNPKTLGQQSSKRRKARAVYLMEEACLRCPGPSEVHQMPFRLCSHPASNTAGQVSDGARLLTRSIVSFKASPSRSEPRARVSFPVIVLPRNSTVYISWRHMPCSTCLSAIIPSQDLPWGSTAASHIGNGSSSRCFWGLILLELIPVVLRAPHYELGLLPPCKDPLSAILDILLNGTNFPVSSGAGQLHHMT